MSDLDRLFYWHGIAPDFINFKGEHVSVSLENRTRLLETMGVDTSTSECISKAAYDLDVAPWKRWLAPMLIAYSGEGALVGVNFHPDDLGKSLRWVLSIEEGGVVAEGIYKPDEANEVGDYEYGGVRYSRRELSLPSLDPNYYQLKLAVRERVEVATVAVAPKSCYRPDWLSPQAKSTGVIIQLYTLKSDTNWGVGDFTDLKGLVKYLSSKGFDAIGLNPLHALLPELEEHCSPYSPSDRRFIDPLYICLESEPEYQSVIKQMPECERNELSSDLMHLKSSQVVDYVEVSRIKQRTLKAMFATFQTAAESEASERRLALSEFVERNGAPLMRYALFQVLKQALTSFENIVTLMDAPQDDPLITACLVEYKEDLEFVYFQQWLADKQFRSCQELTVALGMKVGLIRDLAVGADRGGSEVLSNQHLFCANAAAGAPPDAFSAIGQNWGLPPMDPAGLRKSGFRHFRSLLRSNMENCGALRIDHAMGLMRLWWCPPGKTADYGAYVYYPFEELIALLKLESVLNECAVIGEDLGIVPHNFRETMFEAGVVSNKVFYFERYGPTEFKPPGHYDEYALAMVNNHDVPTLASWWNGDDIRLRQSLGTLGEGVDVDGLMHERLFEKQNLVHQLRNDGAFPGEWESKDINHSADKPLVFAILRWMASVNSTLFVIQLEDLMLMTDPVNVPGTYKEYPNWKRKLSVGVAELEREDSVSELLIEVSGLRKQ